MPSLMPMVNPYSYFGASESWREGELHKVFATAKVLEVGALKVYEAGQSSTSLFAAVGNNQSSNIIGGFMDHMTPTGETWTLKIAKVGVLMRKDDILEGGKRSSARKWRTLSFVLTGSQLLLFRDPSWVDFFTLDEREGNADRNYPGFTFKPDEVWSLKGAIAVHDSSYMKVQPVVSRDKFTLKAVLVSKYIPICLARWSPISTPHQRRAQSA